MCESLRRRREACESSVRVRWAGGATVTPPPDLAISSSRLKTRPGSRGERQQQPELLVRQRDRAPRPPRPGARARRSRAFRREGATMLGPPPPAQQGGDASPQLRVGEAARRRSRRSRARSRGSARAVRSARGDDDRQIAVDSGRGAVRVAHMPSSSRPSPSGRPRSTTIRSTSDASTSPRAPRPLRPRGSRIRRPSGCRQGTLGRRGRRRRRGLCWGLQRSHQ